MAKKRKSSSRRRPGKRSSKAADAHPDRSSRPDDLHADVIRAFFEAAEEFAAAESILSETGAFRLHAPSAGVDGLVACFVDFEEDGSGFLVLPSVGHYRDLTTSVGRTPRDRSGLLVLFAPRSHVPKSLRRDLETLGWSASGNGRIPLVTKRGKSGRDLSPTENDYRLATLAAHAMTHAAERAGETILAENALFQSTVEHEEWGNVEILHPGDLDEDELASIVESGIEATIRLPEDALIDASNVEFLSPKAKALLERARPTESPGVLELSAALDELAHLGEMLRVAAERGGHPGSLWETAARFTKASKGPDSWVDEMTDTSGEEIDGPLGLVRTGFPAQGRKQRPTGNRSTPGTNERRLYRLRITLRGIKPPIWRRIELRSDIALAELHPAIQDAMGWDDCHLHQFECGDEIFGDDEDEPDEVESEHSVRLDDLLDEVGDNLVYRYDFGDDWQHLVLLESIEPLPKGKRAPRPRCVDGRRACPPEDCGGPGGYARLLEALANPRDPDHATYVDWVGGGFNPEAF